MKTIQALGTITGGDESKMTVGERERGFDTVENTRKKDVLYDLVSNRVKSNQLLMVILLLVMR